MTPPPADHTPEPRDSPAQQVAKQPPDAEAVSLFRHKAACLAMEQGPWNWDGTRLSSAARDASDGYCLLLAADCLATVFSGGLDRCARIAR